MEGAERLLIQAAAPVGGGKGWPGFEIDHSEPKARVWRSRGRAAAHGCTKQPPSKAGLSGARKTAGAHSNKHSNSHNNKHNNGGAATGLRPRSCPPARSPTRLQLGAFEAEDVEELACTIR